MLLPPNQNFDKCIPEVLVSCTSQLILYPVLEHIWATLHAAKVKIRVLYVAPDCFNLSI